MFVDPGERLFEIEAEGYRATRHRVRIAPGADVDFRVDLVLEDTSAIGPVAPLGASARRDMLPSQPTRTPVYARWWFWTILGVVIAGGVATGVVLANQPPATPDVGQSVTVEALTLR